MNNNNFNDDSTNELNNQPNEFIDDEPIVTMSKEELEKKAIEFDNKYKMSQSVVALIILIPFFLLFGKSIFSEKNKPFMPVMVIFMTLFFLIIMIAVSNYINASNSNKVLQHIDHKQLKNLNNGEQNYNTITKKSVDFKQLYIIVFGIFWFGFLITADYFAIQKWNDGGNQQFIFSLIFWITGFFVIGKNLKTK